MFFGQGRSDWLKAAEDVVEGQECFIQTVIPALVVPAHHQCNLVYSGFESFQDLRRNPFRNLGTVMKCSLLGTDQKDDTEDWPERPR